MDKGNDYLPALGISSSAGVDVREMYLEMRAQPRWRHRTLVVLDPDRAAAAFDTDMLLRLLLDAHARAFCGSGVAQAPERGAVAAGAAEASEEAAALGSAVADALQRGLAPEHEFPKVVKKDEVWAAWRAELPAVLQVEALVAAATEPRVAAARDALAAARGGSGDEMATHGGGDGRRAVQAGALPRTELDAPGGAVDLEEGAKGMRAALAQVKVRRA